MKSGPKPRPSAVLRLQGTYRPHRRHGEPEAPGDLAALGPPDWLTPDQQNVWRSVLARAPRSVLRTIDAELLAAYCEVVDRHHRAIEAQRALDRGATMPFLVKGRDGPQISPLLRIINRSLDQMLRLSSELGFSPASRAGLGEPPDEDDTSRFGFIVIPGRKQ